MNICVLLVAIVKMFWTMLFNRKIKIVHIHTSSYIAFRRTSIFVRIASWFNKVIILHVHSGAFKRYYYENKRYVKKVLRKCDVIVALTEHWKDFFVNEAMCPNVYVIPNVVPFHETTARSVAKGEKVRFLFLGMIEENKGIFELLNAIEHNRENWKEKCHFYIAGEGKTKTLGELIKDAHIDKLVSYEGWVKGERKEHFLSSCDVLVLPSYYEGLPMAILEAMSHGMSIIATKVGGIPEIVHDKLNGFLIRPGESKQIVKAINMVLQNPEQITNHAIYSSQFIETYYPDNVGDKLTNMYQSVLNEL